MSPFTRWLCRDCKEVFVSEAEMVEHISTTGHTEVSLQRSRALSG